MQRRAHPSFWTDGGRRDRFDLAVLIVVVIAVVLCALMVWGTRIAPFIISHAYAEDNLPVSITVAVMAALLGTYMVLVWMPYDERDFRAAAIVVCASAALGYFTAAEGLPVALGSLSGETRTVVFTATRTVAAGRRSCAGAVFSHPDYFDRKLCLRDARVGMRVVFTGRVSWYGLRYNDYKLIR